MMGKADLSDPDIAVLIELLRETIEGDRFPLSPRIPVTRWTPG
jgi:hypothetical protein